MTIIPERDLYRLVMRSKLPSAERFEEWVVGTVLPAIRKTGSYVKGEEVLDPNAPDYLDRLKDLMLAAQGRKLAEAEARILDHLHEKVAAQKAQLEAQAPKVAALERLSASEGSYNLSDAARELGLAQRTFFKWLADNGWTFRERRTNRPIPYADKRKAGLMEVVPSVVWVRGAEVAVQSTYITRKGLDTIAEILGVTRWS